MLIYIEEIQKHISKAVEKLNRRCKYLLKVLTFRFVYEFLALSVNRDYPCVHHNKQHGRLSREALTVPSEK